MDEVESINAEAQRLIRDVPDLFTIIVLSHCGYDVEQKIAKNVGPKISLIVGGHSHSLLYNGKKLFLFNTICATSIAFQAH